MKKISLLLISCLVLSLSSSAGGASAASKYEVDYVGDLSEDMAVFGLWRGEWDYGYINNKAKVIIKPQYQDAGDFICGVASVGVKSSDKAIKYGYIKKDGSYLIKPKFDEAGYFHKIPGTNTEVAIVGIGEEKSTRKYGFVKKDGSYLVEPQFDYVSEYTNINSSAGGFTNVYNIVDGKERFGILNSKGKLIIDTKYSYASVHELDVASGYILINNDYLFGFYDIKRDKLFDPVYSTVTFYDNGVKFSKVIDYREKYGYYLNNGTMVEPKYDALSHWDSQAVLCKTQLNNKYGLLGKNGTEILEPIYDKIRDLGTWQYAEIDGKTILITKDGEIVNDMKFDSAGHLSYFNLLNVKVNGKTGLLDLSTYEYLVEPIYDEIYAIEDGFMEVKLDGKEGILDRRGRVVLEPVYDYIYRNYYTSQIQIKNSDGSYSYQYDKSKPPVVKVKKDGKEYFLNNDFTPMTDSKGKDKGSFDTIGAFERGIARVTKDGKIGYVREDLTYIVEPIWDSAYQHFDIIDGNQVYYDYFDIKMGDKWGVAFMDGTVIKPVSESSCKVGEDIAVVRVNGKYRYMNKNNKYINKEEYVSAEPFSEGVGLAFKDFIECYFIDKSGKRVSDIYKGGSGYSEGLAFVQTDTGGKYIDHDGKIIIGNDFFMYYGHPFSNGVAFVAPQENGKALYGVMKKDGTWLVKPMFDTVISKNGKWVPCLNGKEAEVTSSGKIIWK